MKGGQVRRGWQLLIEMSFVFFHSFIKLTFLYSLAKLLFHDMMSDCLRPGLSWPVLVVDVE